jgi:hypothetical protein
VRHETGSIPFGKEEPLEKYAYRELELCDIIISIIGGRFGTESQSEKEYSISQKELLKALERNIPVFIFIESNVLSEYSTYKLNKDVKDIKYNFVNDVRIYSFIEQVYKLPNNNPIAKFETSSDIVEYLRMQWAGLFQRYLQEQKRISELKILEEMKTIAGTLQQLVNFLTDERRNKDEAIQSILTANHPAFRRFSKVVGVGYRIYFTNITELENWLKARTFDRLDAEYKDEGSIYEWISTKNEQIIKLKQDIFDSEGKLKIYTEHEWNDDWVIEDTIVLEGKDKDDDIPF